MENFNFRKNISKEFYWYNEPNKYYFDNGLIIKTDSLRDFWQKTHYGFTKDDGHCLLTSKQGDFSFVAHLSFEAENLYDQCGLIVRIDKENWIKASIEYEDENSSKLGSVVTNLGYSDWASVDISSKIKSMWYKVSIKENDFLLENSYDGKKWLQMRIGHIHKNTKKVEVGVYACSPQNGSFECRITKMIFDDNHWN